MMKKTTSLLLATAIAGSLALTALAPAAYADNRGQGMRKHDGKGEYGEHMRGQMGQRGQGGPGGFIGLMCSERGAERLETALNFVGGKLTLTDEQQTLLDNLKTAALTAQTEYADSCITGPRDGSGNVVDRIKHRQSNMQAQIAAMDDVIPALEAFYDSLTEEQQAALKQGPRGERGRGFGSQDGRGFGPRDGSGFGHRNRG